MSSVAALRVARTAIPRARAIQTRSIHSTRTAHSNPTDANWHLPFYIPGPHSSKALFATKMVTYLGVGFSIPFIACYWQFYKSK